MSKSRRGVFPIVLAVAIAFLVATGAGYLALGGAATFHPANGDAAFSAEPHFNQPKQPFSKLISDKGLPTESGIERVLGSDLRRPELGSLSARVVDVITQSVVFAQEDIQPVVPASTNKIATTVAALAVLGPNHRIPTYVVPGRTANEVVLVGKGDVTLAKNGQGFYAGAARLDQLAKKVKKSHQGKINKVIVDSSAFVGPTIGPAWDADVIHAGFAAPITALALNGGRLTASNDSPRASEPDMAAAEAFAAALGGDITVVPGRAPANTHPIATVSSAPMITLVEQALRISDNTLSEALARQVAFKLHEDASFEGAAAAISEALTDLGIDVSDAVFADGSGLSRNNRLSAKQLTQLLLLTAHPKHPELRAVLTGLPVAHYSGTLNERFQSLQTIKAAGKVRAKTGTLSGTSALSGVVVTVDGRQLAFTLLATGYADGNRLTVEATLDLLAARIASCGCQ